MNYYCNLYLDEYVSANREDIVWKLENDVWQLEIYIIALSSNKQNHLDIYNSALLLQKPMHKEKQMIVGITHGYNEAIEMIEKIAKEVYDNTNGTDIKKYILDNQEMHKEGNK